MKQILSNQTQNNINGVISYLFLTENLRLHHLRHSLGRHFQPTSLLNLLFHQMGVNSKYKAYTGEKKTTALICTCCVYIKFNLCVNEILSGGIPDQFRFASLTLDGARARFFSFFVDYLEMMGYLQTTKNYNHPSCASKAEKRDWNREVDSVGSWAYEYYCFL